MTGQYIFHKLKNSLSLNKEEKLVAHSTNASVLKLSVPGFLMRISFRNVQLIFIIDFCEINVHEKAFCTDDQLMSIKIFILNTFADIVCLNAK